MGFKVDVNLPVGFAGLQGEQGEQGIQGERGLPGDGTIKDGVDTIYASVEARKQTPTKNNALQVQIGPADIISNLPVVIDFDHHQVHEGESFRYDFFVTLSNGVSKDIRIVVPNITITTSAAAQCPHLRYEFVSSAAGTAYIYEGTTFTANGTERTPIAMERNGTYTPKVTLWEDPTVNVLGAPIFRGLLTTAKSGAGNLGDSALEFILKNNKTYHLRFTAGANGNDVLIRILWYEDLGV